MKKQSERTDIVSRTIYPRETLLRFVIKDEKLILDKEKSLPGRGVYLKKGNGKDAIKKASFNRYLHRPLSKEEEELIEKL
ncbi:MAG: DUF448 domain-containing protein [Bacilli bacterium]|nr:DUF448 domain-containing protein [Bacilli bacterium]